ncbi:MAG: TIM barrel protein [Lachnospiraceae bacterium]|nr:TIM barrel protein [Lachnospiraceae bacterium]
MKTDQKLQLGISGQALGEVMEFEKIVELAAKYDIRHFELWPCNVPGTGFGYRDRDISVIQRIQKEKDIVIDCVTLEAAFCEQAVETPEYYTELLKGSIDAACAVGAKLVNHYCYFINLDEKPDFERMDAFWLPALAYAKEKGITLVLENEAHDATRRPELTAAIMEHYQDAAFLTNYDATNYFHASAEAFPAAYEILKPYIGYVHLKNACIHREGAGQPKENLGAPMSGVFEPASIQYAVIPEGSVNVAGILTQLLKDGIYTGTCTLEPHTTPECVEHFYQVESTWLRERGYF